MSTKKCECQAIELKYTGYLSDSSNLFLHYGYNGWDEVSECKMKKLKSCYKAEVTLPCESKLDFCFRNDCGDWDNNYGNDYTFAYGKENDYACIEVLKKAEKTVKTSTVAKVKSAIEATKKVAASTKKVAKK